MADNLQDVVQHLTDGAVAQGYLTPAQAQDAIAAAARGERPDIDLSAAPQSVRDAADHVLDQATTQTQADATRADARADLDNRWADHTADRDSALADANALKTDFDAVGPHVDAAEAAVGHADDLISGKPTLADALVNDNDLNSYRTVMEEVAPQARPYLDEAHDQLQESREGLIDVGDRLADQLRNADALEAQNDALWAEENAHKAVDATTAQTWTVLEGQADDAYATTSDAAAHTDDAHAVHAEPAHIEAAPHADAPADTHAADQPVPEPVAGE